MQIKDEYKPIYRTPRSCCARRPASRTCILSLDPGTRRAGEIDEGGRVRVANTLPDVNADEVLAQLDADTRDYLRDPAERRRDRLRRRGDRRRPALRADRRAGPARDVQALRAHRARRQAAHPPADAPAPATSSASSTTSRSSRQRSARRDHQLRALVDSANANFEAFAAEEAALREALRLFPGALDQTETTLRKTSTLAAELGPTLEGLRPFARELAPALRKTRPFFSETTPIIRDQIRPFARDVQPTVRDLRAATEDLAPWSRRG